MKKNKASGMLALFNWYLIKVLVVLVLVVLVGCVHHHLQCLA